MDNFVPQVVLQRILNNRLPIKATFLPHHGMNLCSFCIGEIEYIDQNTLPEFIERRAGLGPLIGPHFYHRENPAKVSNEAVFPFIAKQHAKKIKEPFSHGIARYVPWRFSATDIQIKGELLGSDRYAGMLIRELEGFDFTMHFSAYLTETGLSIEIITSSPTHPCVTGLHYYLALENNWGLVEMPCSSQYNDMGTWKPIPGEWLSSNGNLRFDLKNTSDFGFIPGEHQLGNQAFLSSGSKKLHIVYSTDSEHNAFQLYHPQDASFVCIEPVTAQNPRAATLQKNHLIVHFRPALNS